jgi:4-hydroxybenzoate polyprenyltransferase
MIARMRLIVLLTRPPVVVLLALFAATGLAEAGHPTADAAMGRVLVVVIGFLLFSVACNDLADEAVDRVNLPGKRPLVTGAVTRHEFTVIGLTAGAVALATSVTMGWRPAVVTAAGMTLSAGYSLPPVRLARRGAVASLLLPACYVAVPFLLGLLAVRPHAGPGTGSGPVIRPADLALLAGLYLGFIGRILLKDFRDVRGDALFGKRTFLVRYGRRWTCAVSACCWLAGTAVIVAVVRQPTPMLAAALAACAIAAVGLLWVLARDPGAHRDELVISAIAIIGRGMVLMLLAHLAMTDNHWSPGLSSLMVAGLAVVIAGQAAGMLRHGPAVAFALRPGWPGRPATAPAERRTAQPQSAGPVR